VKEKKKEKRLFQKGGKTLIVEHPICDRGAGAARGDGKDAHFKR